MDNKEEIRQRIEDEILKTEMQVTEYRELCKPDEPDCAIGRVSRMDAINNRSVTEASLRKAEEKLNTLNIVLAKIDDDDFGKCLRCGNEIPLGRILIRPESMHCVNCDRRI
ncbi:MAG: TraR/DksA C4-type zinc finger protein [Bacteroidales bacterium]|nr:TraR/DksA C4-type zinc finger protein [Bacteroidales bacterium]